MRSSVVVLLPGQIRVQNRTALTAWQNGRRSRNNRLVEVFASVEISVADFPRSLDDAFNVREALP